MTRYIDKIIDQVTRRPPSVRVRQHQVKDPAVDDDGIWFCSLPGIDRDIQIESTKGKRTAVTRWLLALGLATTLCLAGVAAASLAPGDAPPDHAATPAESAEGTGRAPRVDREGFPLPAEVLARVGSARMRHGRSLCGLEYSPDGTLLATCGGDFFHERGGLLRLWDARKGTLVWQSPALFNNFYSNCAFSADGKMVVVLDGDTCRWFDARSGRPLPDRNFKVPEGTGISRLGPHGDMVVTIPDDQTKDLVVYDLPSGNERFRKAAEGFYWSDCPAFSADGKTLAMMEAPGKPEDSSDYRARLFDLKTGRQIGVFGIGEHFTGLSLSANGKRLAAHGDSNRQVSVWSVPDGKRLHHFQADVDSTSAVAFAPDGKSVVVGSYYLDASRVDLATSRVLSRYRTHGFGHRLAFTPDGKRLAVGLRDGLVSQWDLATGERLDASAQLAALHSVHFDATSKVLQFWDDAVVSVEWRSGREVRRVRVPYVGSNDLVCLSPDLSRVVAGDDIWDAASGKEIGASSFRMVCGYLKSFSSDGKALYFAQRNGPVGGWDVDRGTDLPEFDKKARNTAELAVSADGRRLAVAEWPKDPDAKVRQEIITAWDLPARRELRRLLPPAEARVTALALGPDGSYLAAAGVAPDESSGSEHGLIEIWDMRSGKEWLLRTDLPELLMTVTFSGDGRMLATGSSKGELTLWEIATRVERHRFAGHENAIREIAFSHGDKFLASTSCDAPIFVWDVEDRDGKPLSALPFTSKEGTNLWQALSDAKASSAFDAMRLLLARPGPAVALLRERLRPARTFDEKGVPQLLSDLDSEDFAVRERASAALELIADRAAPILRKALQDKPAAEAKRRLEQLLEAAEPGGSCRNREGRAVEIAERIGSAEARGLLDVWGAGDKDASLTREAQVAIARLKRR
jgi:WD40 repeat protein